MFKQHNTNILTQEEFTNQYLVKKLSEVGAERGQLFHSLSSMSAALRCFYEPSYTDEAT